MRTPADLDHLLKPPMPARRGPPSVLTWRHLLLARLMVHGLSDAGVLVFLRRTELTKVDGKAKSIDLPPPQPGEPLDATEAGTLLGLKKRYVRELVKAPLFHAALEAERARSPDDLVPASQAQPARVRVADLPGFAGGYRRAAMAAS